MRQHLSITQKGFTLLEMLLVLVIAASILYMYFGRLQQQTKENQVARSSMQMQQILVAAAAYYVDKNKWPTDIAAMKGTYIPTGALLNSPWDGAAYTVTGTKTNFYVIATIRQINAATARAYATILTGRLPIAYMTGDATATPPAISACTTNICYVVAQIGIPPQNLNKAMGMNFAGLYHHGACVPVPKCKIDTDSTGATALMKPQVFIVPVSVSGLNDNNSTNTYPISSYTGYATGPGGNPDACTGSTTKPGCSGGSSFWRACVQVVTQRGAVGPPENTSDWGQYVTVAAFTRCAPNASPGEPSGSDFSVYSN